MDSSSSLPCLPIPFYLAPTAEVIRQWARNEHDASEAQVQFLLACMKYKLP